MKQKLSLALYLALTCQLCILVDDTDAQFWSGSRLLLSQFEVDLDGAEITTLFAVTNTANETATVRASVYSNWGVQVLETTFELAPHQVISADLHRWLSAGKLPDRTLEAGELEHLQAALTGERSPLDGLYYSRELAFRRATGYVTFHVTQGPFGRPVLIGDSFIVVPGEDSAQGQALLNVDPRAECEKLCLRHGLRFLTGGFDGGTEIFIWTPVRGSASDSGFFPVRRRVRAEILVYDEPGRLIDTRSLELLPVDVLRVSELGLPAEFGWIDIRTDELSFIGVRYTAQKRFSVGLKTFCIPEEPDPEPRIRIEKATNGVDADTAPGPTIPAGGTVTWTYAVSNIGDVPLSAVTVTDDVEGHVSCPRSTLEPGESMTCTLRAGSVEPCQYANVGTATGTAPDGTRVSDSDPSHYNGPCEAEAICTLSLEKHTNGEDADTAPGPEIPVGGTVTWEYFVTNTADPADPSSRAAENVQVTDDKEGAISCPKSRLTPGESMTCVKTSTAELGQYANRGEVTASNCGADDDPSHYRGKEPKKPDIDLEKFTVDPAGTPHDADRPNGPNIPYGHPVTWLYQVANTGNVPLTQVAVVDDVQGPAACPRSTLAPGESMTCSLQGTAVCGRYRNDAVATGRPPTGPPVSDEDPSHYWGNQCDPGIEIEKYTIDPGGFAHDADQPSGPTIPYGAPVTWRYDVTNTGQVPLRNVSVQDNRLRGFVCQGLTLAPGESTTCTAEGVAGCGQYVNRGTASGVSPDNRWVQDVDPSHYFGECEPGLRIEKSTRGADGILYDADEAPGPLIPYRDRVEWIYTVTNTGNVTLSGVGVTDDRQGAVSCPKSTLGPGESMTCSADDLSIYCGQYRNVGTASGSYLGANGSFVRVSSSDPSHYFCDCTPGVRLEKSTNGQDADDAPGPTIQAGDPVTWTYTVTNVGLVPLTDIDIYDDREGTVSCPQSTLEAGQSMTCTVLGTATCGPYSNVGTVSARFPDASGSIVHVSDADASHYLGDC